jgi:hypothetical protein
MRLFLGNVIEIDAVVFIFFSSGLVPSSVRRVRTILVHTCSGGKGYSRAEQKNIEHVSLTSDWTETDALRFVLVSPTEIG